MSMDVFQAYVQGYADRLFDQQTIAVQTGYWAAYYTNSKHPKSVNRIIEGLQKEHNKQKKRPKTHVERPDVDVEAFLAQEEQFKRRLKQAGGG